MRFPDKRFAILVFILVLCFGLSACSQDDSTTEIIEDRWAQSAHNDIESNSFNYWDEQEPPEIPVGCAKCHSTSGYLDFLGADGSIPGQVDHPAPIGTTIECDVCHDSAAESRGFANMPSGARITGLGQESNCMECHQGRTSASQVAEVVNDHSADMINIDLKLPNVHNNAAAATFYGSQARGGGEYPQQSYAAGFYHGFDTCITCHDPHTLAVSVKNCSACHLGAATVEGVRNIRLSKLDYDGDGNIKEGLAGEIETLLEKLLSTIRLYALVTENAEPILYNDRFVTENEAAYATWTPRLLQAAYNYQYVIKDPGSYSHNPKYVIQLLYDSIEDLGGDTRGMSRP